MKLLLNYKTLIFKCQTLCCTYILYHKRDGSAFMLLWNFAGHLPHYLANYFLVDLRFTNRFLAGAFLSNSTHSASVNVAGSESLGILAFFLPSVM